MSKKFRSKSKEIKISFSKDKKQETTNDKKPENNNLEEQERKSPYPRKPKKKISLFSSKKYLLP